MCHWCSGLAVIGKTYIPHPCCHTVTIVLGICNKAGWREMAVPVRGESVHGYPHTMVTRISRTLPHWDTNYIVPPRLASLPLRSAMLLAHFIICKLPCSTGLHRMSDQGIVYLSYQANCIGKLLTDDPIQHGLEILERCKDMREQLLL